jgi:hypothetical protein
MGPNKSLDMKQLSLKLAMLMALTSVSRGSELAKVNPQLMNDAGNHTTFQIAGLTKTKRQNKPHLSFVFYSYTNDETNIKCSSLLTGIYSTNEKHKNNRDPKSSSCFWLTQNHINQWLKLFYC